MTLVETMVAQLRARGLTISRMQALHPAIDRAVRRTRRQLYTRRFFRAGPRTPKAPGGRTFVILNHCYDLDVEALCAAATPHELWVLDPFALFTDIHHFFPPEHRDLACVYGAGAMAGTIARYKRELATDFARQLVRRTRLDALITPSDTFYYLRPIIEELRALGVPTVVQCKEGTIAPGAMMDEHAALLGHRYPPIADAYLLWSENHARFWGKVGVPAARMQVLGQPRSDFFFHRERWPSKQALGLTEGKRLVVAFTFDADSYVRVLEPNRDRPWKANRDAMHAAVKRIARERPDVEVVIKAHPQQEELAEVTAEVAADPIANVRLLTGAGLANPLLAHADVILGFQSTVMIEAMLTKAPVFYMGWGDWHPRFEAGLIPIHTSGGVVIPRGPEDLEHQLREALDGRLAPSPEMLRARKAFTDRYFADADGRVAERVLRAAVAVADQPRSDRRQAT
jgi:CDP-Glycerol:Poly(glycerophosphate) glycerophosphotransferase